MVEQIKIKLIAFELKAINKIKSRTEKDKKLIINHVIDRQIKDGFKIE